MLMLMFVVLQQHGLTEKVWRQCFWWRGSGGVWLMCRKGGSGSLDQWHVRSFCSPTWCVGMCVAVSDCTCVRVCACHCVAAALWMLHILTVTD